MFVGPERGPSKNMIQSAREWDASSDVELSLNNVFE